MRAVAVVATTLVAATATANAAGDPNPAKPYALVEIGGATNPRSGDPNPLGFEFGGQIGLLRSQFYGGLSFYYSLGGTAEFEEMICPIPCKSEDSLSARSIRYGLFVAYGIPIHRRASLNGQLLLGDLNTWYRRVTSGRSEDQFSDRLFVEPGCSVTLSLGPIIIGADVNWLWLLGNSVVAVTSHALTGTHL